MRQYSLQSQRNLHFVLLGSDQLPNLLFFHHMLRLFDWVHPQQQYLPNMQCKVPQLPILQPEPMHRLPPWFLHPRQCELYHELLGSQLPTMPDKQQPTLLHLPTGLQRGEWTMSDINLLASPLVQRTGLRLPHHEISQRQCVHILFYCQLHILSGQYLHSLFQRILPHIGNMQQLSYKLPFLHSKWPLHALR